MLLINIFKASNCSDLLFGVGSQPSEDNQAGNNFNYIKGISYRRKEYTLHISEKDKKLQVKLQQSLQVKISAKIYSEDDVKVC